jgi:elongation factor Ts
LKDNFRRKNIMAFTAKDVQALREKTGVGMMDCKKALVEADGDIDKAIDILREKGLASAAKKASRVAAEGVVAAYNDDKAGALVEINCETDFVAKGEPFVNLAAKVVKTVVAAKPADVEALLATKAVDSDKTVDEEVQEVFLALRENMKVRRFALVEGHTVTYIHAGGSVGVLVAFDVDDATAANDEFVAMGKNVAMQVAAMSPEYLSKSDISAEELAKMESITIDSALNKPDTLPMPILNSIIEEAMSANKWSNEDIEIYKGLDQKQRKNFVNFISKEAYATLAEIAVSRKEEISGNKIFAGLVAGRLAKQIKEVCLLEQPFVRSDLFDGDVNGYINSVAKALGAEIKAASFVRFAKGEGIEKKVDDFAAEIASMVK